MYCIPPSKTTEPEKGISALYDFKSPHPLFTMSRTGKRLSPTQEKGRRSDAGIVRFHTHDIPFFIATLKRKKRCYDMESGQALETGIYHVIARGAGRRILLEDNIDRAFFLERLHAGRFYGKGLADSIATGPKEDRGKATKELGAAGLSVRRIERLKGIGRGIIQECRPEI